MKTEKAYIIANGRKIIFKLHPNENYKRAVREIERYAPGSLIYQKEKIEPMIANCDVLITRYSSVVYIGLALGKEVHSDFDVDELKQQVPIQNGGFSAFHIAQIGRRLLAENKISNVYSINRSTLKQFSLRERLSFKRKLSKIRR